MSGAYDGQGTTVTFGTSGFAARLIDVGGPAMKRGAIEASVMSDEDWKRKIPEALADGGEVTLTVEHDGSDNPPINEEAETITIDYGGLGNSWSFQGFCTGYDPGAKMGERMQATLTLAVDGEITM
jgi:hypothetical protein